MLAGSALCVRCGLPIVAGMFALRLKSGGVRMVSNWVADHNADRSGYNGPAHYRCNARAGAQAGNRKRAGRRRPVVRTWGSW